MKGTFLLFILFLIYCMPVNASSAWTKKANFEGQARHRTTAFSVGSKGYLGLGHYNSGDEGNVVKEDFWEYDPASDSWTQIADFGGGQRYHAMDFVKNGKAYVFGGRIEDAIFMDDLWEYDPISNAWTSKAPLTGGARIGAMSWTYGEYGVIAMGQLQDFSVGTDIYAYHFETDTWYIAPDFAGPPRISGIAFVLNDIPYIATGYGYIGSMNDCWKMDTATWTWSECAGTVGPQIRAQSHGFTIQGKGYIVSGNDWETTENFPDVWRFDPDTETWDQIGDFPGLARRYLDGFEINDQAYMGAGTNGTNLKDFWEFDPTNAVGIGEPENPQIKIYPNPATDYIQLETNDPELFAVTIFNSEGKIINAIPFVNSETQIQIDYLASGTYYYHIESMEGTICKGQFQKD